MGFINRLGAPAAAVERYERAYRALCENAVTEYAAGVMDETPEYLAANREVAEAEHGVSWWRRCLVDRRVLRETDYWRGTGQDCTLGESVRYYLSRQFLRNLATSRECNRVVAAIAAAGDDNEKRRIREDYIRYLDGRQ